MRRVTLLGIAMLAASAASADEGMWTLDNFPSDRVEDKYGVSIDQAWLDRVRRSTTRFDSGCSGSFISPDGLVLTNHHCIRRCISDNSTPEFDAQEQGFIARTRAEERPCAADSLSVLMDIEEITDKIQDAVKGKDEQEANTIRKQTLTSLEQACEAAADEAGEPRSCESVSLYNGGQYFLYKYKRFSDVRLVFVPETPIAAFGGDPDNFNFPRWCLDMAILRAWDGDEPASTPDFLSWRVEGAAAGEAVFVAGHPGSTQRLLTMSQLRLLRDLTVPVWLLRYSELRGRLIEFSAQGPEQSRIAKGRLQAIENGITVRRNELFALLDEDVLAIKQAQEDELRKAVNDSRRLRKQYATAWDEIDAALKVYRGMYEQRLFAEQAAGFTSPLFSYARTLVRGADERQLPSEERLREYSEPALPRLRQTTLAPRPIYPEFEIMQLSFSLEKMREWLGPDDDFVKLVLGDESPAAMARRLVEGTALADSDARAALWDGGAEAIAASDDPMIELARRVDPFARAVRKRYEDEVEAPIRVASEKIASARFAVQGTSTYPDATFTLRVTYGAVEGWEEKGTEVTPFTQTRRLFERTTGSDPFRLPETWVKAQDRLDENTSFNFVATTDITGGNSGSPIIDAEANLVGLAFDGNVHSIAGNYFFDPSLNRTVGVHPAIMVEALRTVYGAEHILEELDLR